MRRAETRTVNKIKANGSVTRAMNELSFVADRRLYVAGLERVRSGKPATREQQRATRRYERREEERLRWEYYASIPQKHWRSMSGGRTTQCLHNQAKLYGLPLAGAVINLPDFVRTFHEFLARNAHKLTQDATKDALLLGPDSPALERYRDERAKLARLDRLEREHHLLPREDVHQTMTRIAFIIRQAGEVLNKEYGRDAAAILTDAIDDAQKEMDTKFGRSSGEETDEGKS